jgi:GNAT superfamily N-acetyltransferase
MTEPRLRPARLEECAALSALALRSKASWGYSSDFLEHCAAELTLSPELIPHTFVIETVAGVHGFYALSQLDARRAELELLFVEPSALRHGYGRRLLAHAQRHAREVLGARTLVIQGDPNAAAFYRAAGAVRVGELPSASITGRVLPLYELAC